MPRFACVSVLPMPRFADQTVVSAAPNAIPGRKARWRQHGEPQENAQSSRW
jgi:hypothetical protein